MKRLIKTMALMVVLGCVCMTTILSCGVHLPIDGISNTESSFTASPVDSEIVIKIKDTEFEVMLHDEDIIKYLADKLPVTLLMQDMNSNEKYYFLDEDLPSNAKKYNEINAGDIMLYGEDCIVLFYDDILSSPYSYTKIGQIKDTIGLKDAVGDGDIEVEFLMN